MKIATVSILGLTGICAASLWAQAGNLSKSDASFLQMAAEADMTSAHLGQDAEGHAANDQVKDFGKKLTTDHTNDYQQLSELATKTGEAIPKGIDKQNDHEITSLDRVKGKTFDHAFLTHEVTEHERLVRAFRQEAEHGTNPDVKAYANKALPTIEQHLHDAQNLLKSKV